MKVIIDVTAGRLSLEGDGPDLIKVLEAARSLVPSVNQIQIVTSTDSPRESGAVNRVENSSGGGQGGQTGNKTLRQFVRSLTLSNAAERVAAIGYYVNKVEMKPGFSPKEMDGWFTMCGFQKPSQMSVALFDTKRKYGYIDNGSGRGLWKISNQGENLIIAKIEDSTSVSSGL